MNTFSISGEILILRHSLDFWFLFPPWEKKKICLPENKLNRAIIFSLLQLLRVNTREENEGDVRVTALPDPVLSFHFSQLLSQNRI